MASLASLTDGEVTEFKRLLGAAGLHAEDVREAIRRPYLANAMVWTLKREAKNRDPATAQPGRATVGVECELVHGLFTPAGIQVERVWNWNTIHRLGFTDDEFRQARESVPAWPENRMTAVVLVPYLMDEERTFNQLWYRIAKQYRDAERNESFRLDRQHLRTLEGVGHAKGLRWEVIDLGANWLSDVKSGARVKVHMSVAPSSFRSASLSPHAGVLAALAHHPEWVKAMARGDAPRVWLPGYETVLPDVPEELGEWYGSPLVTFGKSGNLILDMADSGITDPRAAVPEFVL